jgi:geranylgeranyl pyrophosphate synthase
LAEQKMNAFFDKGLEDLEKLNASAERKQPLIELTKQLIERES